MNGPKALAIDFTKSNEDIAEGVEQVLGEPPVRPLLVTIPVAAAYLSVGNTTVKTLIKTGELKSVSIFGARRIPFEALIEFAKRGT